MVTDVKLVEGFEEAQNRVYLQRKWDFFPATSHSFAAGAFVDTTAMVISNGNTRLRSRSFGLTDNEYTAGIRVNFTSVPVSGTDSVRFRRGTDEQIRFDLIRGSTTSFFKVQVKRGSTTLGTTGDISQNAWHYLECYAVISSTTTGEYEVLIDEQSVLSGTAVITSDTGDDEMDVVDFTLDGGIDGTIDDAYIFKGEPRGDCKIKGIFVNAEGSVINWTPSTGTNSAALVDDPPSAPDDTDYVSTNTDNSPDKYTIVPLSGINTAILAIQINATVALATAGLHNFRISVNDVANASTQIDGDDQAVSSTVKSTLTQIFEADSVAAPWTQTSLNQMELVIEARP